MYENRGLPQECAKGVFVWNAFLFEMRLKRAWNAFEMRLKCVFKGFKGIFFIRNAFEMCLKRNAFQTLLLCKITLSPPFHREGHFQFIMGEGETSFYQSFSVKFLLEYPD